ncbi:isopenicillin N synthase family dioxygenase [Embleya sp. NPDC056575]|uniref:isopenicillin N synthase family dioxygenase n=1 Tax=unclassified Embleya TaxID=2699296 RepID=UPI0036BC4336
MGSDESTVTVADGFVPVIDLSSRDTARGRAAIAKAIGNACSSSGFFIIVGHGVPRELIDRMFDRTNSFFKLPEEEKDLIANRPGVSGYRRAGGTLARSLDLQTPPDLCETFAAHVTGELSDQERGQLGDEWASWTHKNIWPKNPPDFRSTWQEYMRVVGDLCADLMRLMALALELDEDFFEDKHDHHGSSVAVNYYPPQIEPPLPGQLRRGPHTDFGSVTVLHMEDDRKGLQVLQGTEWRDVSAIPGSFVVNLGDLMALWTGGRWVSTMHRVVNPERGDTTSRLTMPYFYLPNYDASIEPMQPFSESSAVDRFDTVTVSEWVSRKVQKIFS